MGITEHRVVCISFELFKRRCLSYLGQNGFSYLVTENWDNFGENESFAGFISKFQFIEVQWQMLSKVLHIFELLSLRLA